MATIQEGNYGRLLEPGLRKEFFDSYKEYPEEFSKVFHVNDSKKAVETDVRLGGFGLWETKDSMGSTQYADLPDELALQYIHEEYSSGFIVEEKMIEDEQYNIIMKLPRKLGRAARATIETKAAKVLNNGFDSSVTGYDGQPLFATAHPRLDKGATVSNSLGNVAFTDANLRDAMILSHEQVDDAGIKIQMMPKLLVVHPKLEYTARTIVESSNLSPNGDGTLSSGVSNAATDKNVLQGGLQIIVMHYLEELNSSGVVTAGGGNYPWFILDPTISNESLNFFWRKRLNFKHETDFDTDQYKYKGKMRFSVGYSDFRGIIGGYGA